VAERIAHERVEQVGQSAGYHIRLEVKKGPGTRLLLMTTGTLLRSVPIQRALAADACVLCAL
jgi:ATP-dependent helicase HrpB